MHRREFLLATACTVLTAAPMSRVWAASASQGPKFILLFLRGAYDATNLLVPYASDFYYEARPHIAVPKPGSGRTGALPLDADWALHPALESSLMPLWRARQLTFVPFAGTRDMTRSHFETQDHIELGQGPQIRDYNDGFLNRLVQQLGGRAQPMAFSTQLPLSLRGPQRVANMNLTQRDISGLNTREQRLLEEMWGQTAQAGSVREGFAVEAEIRRDMGSSAWQAEMVAASRGAVQPDAFIREAAKVGALMGAPGRDGFDIGFIDVGGWDTHVNEAGNDGTQGQLAMKLERLGTGLSAMAHAMAGVWRDTVVVVLSEFGRTFRENGNRGTDHGHGTVYWILGGAVRGKRIAGEQVILSPSTLNQNRDYPVLTDFRDLLGGLFQSLWGLSTQRVQAVFPSSRPMDLRLI